MVVPLAVAGLASLGVPPATAADAVVGFSWYSDGAYTKSGPAGTSVTVFATGAKANTPFELVITVAGSALPCPRGLSLAKLNPNTRVSSGNGIISQTVGTVDVPAGDYEICFLERSDLTGFETVTVPVYFTVP